MNLYKISQTANSGYDTYDSAIVAAETVEEAQATLPHKGYKPPTQEAEYDYRADAWTAPENVSVVLIGKATEGTLAGVILASFNAG